MNIENILNPLNSIKLIGMDNYFDELIKLYNSKRMPKVLLISGQKGLGKFTLVNHLVNYIFSGFHLRVLHLYFQNILPFHLGL